MNAGAAVLALKRGRLILYLGPSFVAAVAYIDPGNVATNLVAGADFRFLLLPAVAGASLLGMLVQALSAKVGIATGRDLAEVCAGVTAHPVRIALWLSAEVAAMATDVAELVGAAIALNLLFQVPLPVAAGISAVASLAILELRRRGYRGLELVLAFAIVVIAALCAAEVWFVRAGPTTVHSVAAAAPATSPVFLVGAIVGATIMPHAIFLESALTARRLKLNSDGERRYAYRQTLIDVVLALGMAGLVNCALLVAAALALHGLGPDASTIQGAFATLWDEHGAQVAVIFGVMLLLSGLCSASVGTLAGDVVMRGLLKRRVPMYARRVITMCPAIAVLLIGLPVTSVLVITQVVLSLALPLALVPLIGVTASRQIMGTLANRRRTTVFASMASAAVIAVDLALIVAVV